MVHIYCILPIYGTYSECNYMQVFFGFSTMRMRLLLNYHVVHNISIGFVGLVVWYVSQCKNLFSYLHISHNFLYETLHVLLISLYLK